MRHGVVPWTQLPAPCLAAPALAKAWPAACPRTGPPPDPAR